MGRGPLDFTVPPPPRVSENSPYNTSKWGQLTNSTGPKQTRKAPPTEGTMAAAANGLSGIDASSNINPAEQSQIGMSQLLPGYNNTVERETSFARLPKRQGENNEDDAEAKKAKVARGNTGSSGMLGDHLKEARKKAAADGAATGTIDLTADDDDVVITGGTAKPRRNPDDESVCIGVLTCRANIHRVPACGTFLGREHWPKMKITLRKAASQTSRDAVVELVDRTNQVFGRLAILQADPISQLMIGSHVSGFRVVAFLSPRKRSPTEKVGDAVSQNVAVGLVTFIYARIRVLYMRTDILYARAYVLYARSKIQYARTKFLYAGLKIMYSGLFDVSLRRKVLS